MEAKRWRQTESDGDYSTRDRNADGRIFERYKNRIVGKMHVLQPDSPGWNSGAH